MDMPCVAMLNDGTLTTASQACEGPQAAVPKAPRYAPLLNNPGWFIQETSDGYLRVFQPAPQTAGRQKQNPARKFGVGGVDFPPHVAKKNKKIRKSEE